VCWREDTRWTAGREGQAGVSDGLPLEVLSVCYLYTYNS